MAQPGGITGSSGPAEHYSCCHWLGPPSQTTHLARRFTCLYFDCCLFFGFGYVWGAPSAFQAADRLSSAGRLRLQLCRWRVRKDVSTPRFPGRRTRCVVVSTLFLSGGVGPSRAPGACDSAAGWVLGANRRRTARRCPPFPAAPTLGASGVSAPGVLHRRPTKGRHNDGPKSPERVGRNWALKPPGLTRIGAPGADYCGEAAFPDPEPVWRNSASLARDPGNRLRRKNPLGERPFSSESES